MQGALDKARAPAPPRCVADRLAGSRCGSRRRAGTGPARGGTGCAPLAEGSVRLKPFASVSCVLQRVSDFGARLKELRTGAMTRWRPRHHRGAAIAPGIRPAVRAGVQGQVLHGEGTGCATGDKVPCPQRSCQTRGFSQLAGRLPPSTFASLVHAPRGLAISARVGSQQAGHSAKRSGPRAGPISRKPRRARRNTKDRGDRIGPRQ